MSLRSRLAAIVLFIASASSALADDLTDFFVKLPAVAFTEWAGEDPKPVADPANRARLLAATGEGREAIATELGLRDVKVDGKNGYLSFNSNGDGEGTIFTMTFWKCADGSKLVSAAIEKWTNVANDTSYIAFWRVKDGSFTEVTKDILPDITLAGFYDKHPEKVKAAAADGFRWWWKLPQKGTSIRLEAPALELMDEYADLAQPDRAYEGRWDGKVFTWVKVKAAKKDA